MKYYDWRLPVAFHKESKGMAPTSCPEKCGCFFFDADSRRASHRPRLALTGTPLAFVPVLGFLNVIFGQLSP